jgi:hypothetical protein
VDLRVSKFFDLGKGHRIEIIGDLFNAFNNNVVTNQNVNTGTAFQGPISILGPRVFRIGARWNF